MSVQAPEPGHARDSVRPPGAPDHEPRRDSDVLGPPPRRRSRFGYLWLRALILLLGMLLGAALLATFQATGKLPPPPVGNRNADRESDVIVSIREAYLNRMIAERTADPAQAGPVRNLQVNVQADQRLQFVGEVQVLNQRFQANADGSLGVSDGRVQVQLDEVRVGTLRLPADLGRLIAEPINAELARLVPDDQFRIVDVATVTDRIDVRLAAAPSQSGQRPANP